jgi:hypothetical protein
MLCGNPAKSPRCFTTGMDIITKIAEQRIREAMERGEFDTLPGAGKPLAFEDETWVPEDLRLAYRILKNHGFIPPELELRKEIITTKALMDTIDDDRERIKKLRELNFKIMKLNMLRKKPLQLEDFPEYEQKIYESSLS